MLFTESKFFRPPSHSNVSMRLGLINMMTVRLWVVNDLSARESEKSQALVLPALDLWRCGPEVAGGLRRCGPSRAQVQVQLEVNLVSQLWADSNSLPRHQEIQRDHCSSLTLSSTCLLPPTSRLLAPHLACLVFNNLSPLSAHPPYNSRGHDPA